MGMKVSVSGYIWYQKVSLCSSCIIPLKVVLAINNCGYQQLRHA